MASTIVQVAVSPFFEVLFNDLSSLIQKGLGLAWGVHKEMEKLSSTLSTIQIVLAEAEEKQLTNHAIGNWLRKLKDAAYDADDVLDECASEGLGVASEMRNNSCINQVTDSFLSCMNLKQTVFHYKMGQKIKEHTERFNEIAKEKSDFHLTEGLIERRVDQGRITSSIVTEREVYGRENDKENLVLLLLNNVNNQEDLRICPILGIGRLGKTTLAQLIYNEERVQKHFQVRSWVCVSEDFDVRRLTKAMIESVSGEVCDLQELDALQHHLQKELRGKRFLLVLDDVWNDNEDDWNKLACSLRCEAKGSLIIVTTRLESVASITGTLPPYRLKVLTQEECWLLFKQRAFHFSNEDTPNLVEIGKEIVKKCGGLPLAAKALGGLMRFKHEENEWLFVKNSAVWELPQSNQNNILPALRLSYNYLPSHLKQCFVYGSIFPKDYEIGKEQLIRLWMANGMVQPLSKNGIGGCGECDFQRVVMEILLLRNHERQTWQYRNI